MNLQNSSRLQAVLFDWAGTTVDYGSRAPAEVFVEVFRQSGVAITAAEARGPMGRAKRDHLATIATLPRVAQLWNEVHGRPPDDADIDRMYVEFLPLQKLALEFHSDVIPGVPEVVAECRRRGLKIGSSTGYTRELMELVIPAARRGGYEADVVICAEDVPAGRPAPWMNFRAAEKLNVYPMSAIVVVDDTPVGIAAGKNAGAWTVAVTKTGNSVGCSEAELDLIPAAELASRLRAASEAFLSAGADFVIEGVADLLPVLDRIDAQACSK